MVHEGSEPLLFLQASSALQTLQRRPEPQAILFLSLLCCSWEWQMATALRVSLLKMSARTSVARGSLGAERASGEVCCMYL